MQDEESAERAFANGDTRGGAAVALAGAFLLASTLTDVWQDAAVIPSAIAVAMLVFGGVAFLQGAKALSRAARGDRHSGIEYFETHPEPIFITDLDGRLQARNPAASAAGDPGFFLDPWVSDAGARSYRLMREARAGGVAVEDAEAGGDLRVVVMRTGPKTLVWRIVRRPPAGPSASDLKAADLPWVRIDADGLVLEANAAASPGEEAMQRLEDVLADLPLRPNGVHVFKPTGQSVRVVALSSTPGAQDLLLVPVGGAEIAGLIPDHFLEELPVALARLQPSGHLTYANRAARQLLGPGAQAGINIADIIEGITRPIAERLQDTVRGRALGRSEIARGTVDDAEIYLQLAFTRTVLDGAHLLLAVLSDATELKTLEAQFVQSQKMQAVGQLAGGVAHDFNNLLTAINGHCDLLLMRHDVADLEHADLMQIRQNANRAAALVRQLLAFSRKQTLRPTVINLQDTLGELTHLLNRLLTDKVALRIEHGPDLAPVRVDERQLEQVIMNLVVNARDAMPHGGEVRIATRNICLEQDLHRDRAVILQGDYVVIEVIDSGTGIPENKLNKIFEPFFTTKQVGEGTGLGLSTAYGIIKQTGGFIFADSPAGEGATFTIYLPAYERIEAPVVLEPETRKVRDLTGRGLVLLVEDEDAVRAFAARALRLRGYTVLEAASGEEALEVLKDEHLHVDLMLSDVIMPGMDGPGWVREAQRVRPDAKVIFMSGYAEDAFAGGDSGIPNAVFIPKPFSLVELTERVKDHLEA